MNYVLIVWLSCFFYLSYSFVSGFSSGSDPRRCRSYIDTLLKEIENVHKKKIEAVNIKSCSFQENHGIYIQADVDISGFTVDSVPCTLKISPEEVQTEDVEIICRRYEYVYKLDRYKKPQRQSHTGANGAKPINEYGKYPLYS